jgi:hypothetical protein
MSFTPAQECAARALRDRDPEENLIILVSKEDVRHVLHIIGATIAQEAECYGGTWKFPDGSLLCIRRFTDPPIDLESGYNVVVCNGGRNPNSADRNGIEAWKNAS